MRTFRWFAKRPVVEREPWNPGYTRTVSPGRASQKRFERRRETDPHEVLDRADNEAAAREALIELGVIPSWTGKKCTKCGKGRWKISGGSEKFRCGSCRATISIWKGGPWYRSYMAISVCYHVIVLHAARVSPCAGSICCGIEAGLLGKYMKFFRCAEAWKGRQLQTAVVFQGSPDHPCEVELDESLLKRVKVYGEDGVRTGTIHHAAFAMRQRGSRKTVAYLMEPRFVPVKADNGAASASSPPSAAELLPWLKKHVGDWVVIHCDGARAYASLLEEILRDRAHVYMDAVDHGGHQWTRFQRHAVEGVPGVSRIRVTAGTQFIEAWWKVLKYHCLPAGLTADRVAMETYMLVQVYRMWTVGDPVKDLGATVKAYMEAMDYQPYTNDPGLTKEVQAQELDPEFGEEAHEADFHDQQ